MAFTIIVNGNTHSVHVDGDTPLLWMLRDVLGACTVHLEGSPVRSCVTTIDSVGDPAAGATPAGAKKAWLDRKIPQYVYCQSGQIMSASALLASNPRPTDIDIDDAMSGNICHCGTYVRERTGAISSTPAPQFVGGAGQDSGVSPDRYAGDACLAATRSDDTVPRKHTATPGSGHKEATRDTRKTEAND